MKTISRYIMTLALLLTAVTGAWAEEKMVTINSSTMSSGAVTATGFGILLDNLYVGSNPATITTSEGVITKLVIKKGTIYVDAFTEANVGVTPGTITYGSDEITVTDINVESVTLSRKGDDNWSTSSVDVYFGTAEAPITVEPGSSANTWTFAMPGSDVVLTPQYAPAAQLDENGAPAAVSGLEIAADAAIITAGQSAQGTLLYAVGTSETEKPALTDFAATLPNAKDQTAAGNYYVWYYIQGQDTPQGQEPTAENTFNDSEIMGPVTVELLTNEHTLNIKQSPNITVTVAGTAKTPTDDKVTPVTTGQEVKIKAKEGYKFRKVEVKKGGGAKPLANATTEDLGKVVGADGNIYANKDAAEAANTTAVAMICYVVEGHGLALALTDEVDKMNWSTAQTTCDAHTPAITGGKWMLASKGEWNNMISAAGSYSALRDGFSSVGGTNMQSEGYWSSTEDDSSDAWNYYFSNGLWSDVSKNWNRCVRACLAF